MNVGHAITAALQEQRRRDMWRLLAETGREIDRLLTVFVVPVEWHRVGDIRTGGWCDRCLKPSMVEADMVLVTVATLTPLRRTTTAVCHDCGRTVTS